MGVQDRDWYRDAQVERERRRQIAETRSKFSMLSRKHLGAKPTSTTWSGLIPMMVFWFVVMGLLYGLMTGYLKPKQAQVMSNGDLVINRSQDGHFHMTGNINGIEAKFLIDTGATFVTVSEQFARKALITGGVPTTFKSANGDHPGRIVDGLAVSIGPVRVTNVKVGVGLLMDDEDQALLGQSFLSKFDITMNKNQMTLRSR
jgi:aspartyl protease family protein